MAIGGVDRANGAEGVIGMGGRAAVLALPIGRMTPTGHLKKMKVRAMIGVVPSALQRERMGC